MDIFRVNPPNAHYSGYSTKFFSLQWLTARGPFSRADLGYSPLQAEQHSLQWLLVTGRPGRPANDALPLYRRGERWPLPGGFTEQAAIHCSEKILTTVVTAADYSGC